MGWGWMVGQNLVGQHQLADPIHPETSTRDTGAYPDVS